MADDPLRFDEFLDLLKVCVHQPSVVGAETAFFRFLERELEEAGARVTSYHGLLVAEGERPDHFLLSAHVDRHGLVCTGPGEFQYAAFIAQHRGDQSGDSVSEQTFQAVMGRLEGQAAMAYDPWGGAYLGAGVISHGELCPRRNNMVFEVAGLGELTPGTPLAFRDRLRIDDGWLTAQLDNALTVAVLVHLVRLGFSGTAMFSAQEEAGRSWRFLLEWFQRRDRGTEQLVVLDTSPFPDVDSASRHQVILRRRDANAAFAPATVARLEAACQGRGVEYGFKDAIVDATNARRAEEGRRPLSVGRTEMGRIAAASGGRVQGATLQVPTTGYHTPQETARVDACRAFLGVLADLVLED